MILLPERIVCEEKCSLIEKARAMFYNEALDKVARLNGGAVSVESLANFIAYEYGGAVIENGIEINIATAILEHLRGKDAA